MTVRVWVARSGDRIRVQTEPFPSMYPWPVREGEIPKKLADSWGKGNGGEDEIWDRLAPEEAT